MAKEPPFILGRSLPLLKGLEIHLSRLEVGRGQEVVADFPSRQTSQHCPVKIVTAESDSDTIQTCSHRGGHILGSGARLRLRTALEGDFAPCPAAGPKLSVLRIQGPAPSFR